MSRSQIKSDLPVEITERVKNISNIYNLRPLPFEKRDVCVV